SFHLYVYDLTTKKRVKDLHGQVEESEFPPSFAIVSADGKWLASGGGTVRLWEVAAGKEVRVNTPAGQQFGLLGFTPGNKHLVLCGSNDGALVTVASASGRVART